MHFCLVHRGKPFPLVRTALVVVLTLVFSGWTSCSGSFFSCPSTASQAQITSLSPGSIPGDANSVPLTVTGSGFTPHSQILWNGSWLETTFKDSQHLQATITQQTFESFGGAAGIPVQISVAGSGMGCGPGGNSATLLLVIN
jgi:hypothetical protein